MTVFCGACDCNFYKDGGCVKDTVFIDNTGICDDYTEYCNTADYSKPYYIAVKCVDGCYGKVQRKGKKIEYKGYSFYTNESPEKVKSGDFGCTEEITGAKLYFINLKNKKCWGKFLKLMESAVPVTSYPDARITNDGKYTIAEV